MYESRIVWSCKGDADCAWCLLGERLPEHLLGIETLPGSEPKIEVDKLEQSPLDFGTYTSEESMIYISAILR